MNTNLFSVAMFLLFGCNKEEEEPIPESACMAYDTGPTDTGESGSNEDSGSQDSEESDTGEPSGSTEESGDSGDADQEDGAAEDTASESEAEMMATRTIPHAPVPEPTKSHSQ